MMKSKGTLNLYYNVSLGFKVPHTDDDSLFTRINKLILYNVPKQFFEGAFKKEN